MYLSFNKDFIGTNALSGLRSSEIGESGRWNLMLCS